jgi:hypothetical protein
MTIDEKVDAGKIRADLLGMAVEDCYGLREFYRTWERIFRTASPDAIALVVREQIAKLVDEGFVRVHPGWQCTGDNVATDELNLTGDAFRAISPTEWTREAEIFLNICPTALTQDAFNREYESRIEAQL